MIIPRPQKINLLNEKGYSIDSIFDIEDLACNEIQDTTLPNEGYILAIKENMVELKYKDHIAKERAKASLTQLVKTCGQEIPAMIIEDAPKIQMRAYMLDVARYFFSVEEVLKQIDYLALYKFNTLHLHLNDDQGWRVEIKAFPKLTEIGSIRRRTLFRLKEHKGYYTQDDLRKIVDYAHSKGIRVIPEIDVPGHFQSAIASYPEFGCFNRNVRVAENFGVKFDVACIGKENTVDAIKTIIKELMGIFTDEYFHIGGDEVPSQRWELCPHCKQKYLALGCKNYNEFQAHFMNELGAFIINNGKTPIMWNESNPTGIIDERIVWECWDIDYNNEKFQKEIARGRKIINAKTEPYYLDLPYGINNLKRVYDYEPLVFEENLIGVETCLWGELLPNVKTARKKTFPRLLAVAERLWSNEKDYFSFEQELIQHNKILETFGVKPTPKWLYNPTGIVKIFSKLWWARRVLYWAGLPNIITNAKIKKKYGR